MSNRSLAFRLAAIAGWLTLTAAIFLPIVFVFFFLGGAPQGGQASLWAISPAASVSLASGFVVAGGATLLSSPRRQARWLGPLGGVLIGTAFLAAAYTFSPITKPLGFHPAGLAAVALGGIFLLIASRIGRRDGVKFAPAHEPLGD